MKKKESLKELLERLDSQSATYNTHLEKANQLFDTAIKKMEWLLSHERKDIQATLKRLKQLAKIIDRSRQYAKGKTKGTGKKK
jgi:hypothetical protein